MKQAPFTSKRWQRVEYEGLVDVGAFEGEPLELIGGQLIVAEPKGSPHAAAVGMAGDALRAALPLGWIVRIQNPLALDDESAPEPDVAVVRGSHTDYRGGHPTRAALLSRWRNRALLSIAIRRAASTRVRVLRTTGL
jgi:Uma2 family endonuclease